jgi:hypothetical protein
MIWVVAACFLALLGCNHRTPPAVSEPPGLPLIEIEKSLRPIAKLLGPPQPGDWLSAHEETGQTFADSVIRIYGVKPSAKPIDDGPGTNNLKPGI